MGVAPRRFPVPITATLAVFALCVGLLVVSHGSAEARGCGTAKALSASNTATTFRVSTTGVSCRKGKKVVRKVWRSGRLDRRIGAFRCVSSDGPSGEGGTLAFRCASGNRRIRAYWGNEGS